MAVVLSYVEFSWIFRYPDIEETHIFSCDTFVKTDKKLRKYLGKKYLKAWGVPLLLGSAYPGLVIAMNFYRTS